jgi:hypothetical protein
MIPVSSPPAIVVFEERLATEARNEKISYCRLDFGSCPLQGVAQVRIGDDTAITVQINSLGSTELRSIHTSLRKKAHRPTTDLARNFSW